MSDLKTDDFDYDLPQEYIAQTPVEPRDHSKLLVYDRRKDRIAHYYFYDLVDFLEPNDLLVVNTTKVIPARIFAHKPTGGKAEILLLKKVSEENWECIVGGKRIIPGVELRVGDQIKITILEDLGDSRRLIKIPNLKSDQLDKFGEMPLPPYIHTPLLHVDRYQTIYAKDSGSAAAPTAKLHFTEELLKKISLKGIGICEVTLHVGLDTFQPVMEEDPQDHIIHSEWCEVSEESAERINQTKAQGGRIIAVGTTTVRTLESANETAESGKNVGKYCGPTRLFILPGYQFKVIDGLITNFHLPRSSLIMLVSALTGRKKILQINQQAIENNYRFYSFGDGMFIF